MMRDFGDRCPYESGDPNLNRRMEFWILPQGASVAGIDKNKRGGGGKP